MRYFCAKFCYCAILLFRLIDLDAFSFSQITGSYNDYYRDALRFLGCMNLADVPGEIRICTVLSSLSF